MFQKNFPRDLGRTYTSLSEFKKMISRIDNFYAEKKLSSEFVESVLDDLQGFAELCLSLVRIGELSDTAKVRDMISTGESQTVEFKASMRWDVEEKRRNKDLEKSVAKEVAGFMNSQTGGTLVIGVDDHGNVLGLKEDFATLSRSDKDSYERAFRQLLTNMLGGQEILHYVKNVQFPPIDDKFVFMVTIEKSLTPVFLFDRDEEYFYVRFGNSARLLKPRELIEYYKVRWEKNVRI